MILAQDHLGWHFIDAHCINQHDIVGRGYQVALMRDPYERAAVVTMWLEIPLMDGTQQPVKAFVKKARPRVTDAATDMAMKMLNERFGRDPSDIDRGAMTVWIFAYMNEYWERLWPVQEILVARRLEVKVDQTTLN